MGRLPFETGYLSTMSERELMDLADELQRGTFWNDEDSVKTLVDSYMEHDWRQQQPSYLSYQPFHQSVYATAASNSLIKTLGAPVKTIQIRVPYYLDERTARLFAEIQVREQINPNYDPTEAET